MNVELVLSFSAQQDLLARRESALLDIGYQVFSTESEARARYEIEMGQCGVLLLCYTVHQNAHRDLAESFRRNCQNGIIAFVMHPSLRQPSPHAQLSFLDANFAKQIHLLKVTRPALDNTA
jgi:hypothetical protein